MTTVGCYACGKILHMPETDGKTVDYLVALHRISCDGANATANATCETESHSEGSKPLTN
jgi:hypothetical protein